MTFREYERHYRARQQAGVPDHTDLRQWTLMKDTPKSVREEADYHRPGRASEMLARYALLLEAIQGERVSDELFRKQIGKRL